MKRLTEPRKEYKSQILIALQAFENLGYTPKQIEAKLGLGESGIRELDASVKHSIEVADEDQARRNLMIIVDGEPMHINDFAAVINRNHQTVKDWVKKGVFKQRLQERGYILC